MPEHEDLSQPRVGKVVDSRTSDSTVNDFHDHLDVCKQCREQPYNLCLNGKALLTRVGGFSAEEKSK